MSAPLNVAVVGLGFGEDFLPIYRDHPSVGRIAIVDPSAERLTEVGDRYGLSDRFADIEAVLADPTWDAVHVLAPVSFHADYAIKVLEAGKHCACAVPMALEVQELHAVVAAERRSGKRYMMMETSVYGREYLMAQDMYAAGKLGAVTAYRGFHMQNLDGYPPYWLGYPPMKYLTHALSPLLALTGSAVKSVTAYGSGRLTEDRIGESGNPFPVEVGLFQLRDTDVVADITMSFFQVARTYIEGYSVYGEQMSIEWPQSEGDPMRIFEMLPADPNPPTTGLRGPRFKEYDVVPPDFADRVPPSIAKYVGEYTITPADGAPVLAKRGEHGGSHAYLVHEFISSIIEDRPSAIDAVTAADWTAPGICAHESALAGGTPIDVPTF